ncbi:MAG: enoyl-CoA hydratase-related protein [Candidatus Binatia bacterium]|nr:enoyl-CoA hydratase-related protein [Candidatus Binatia bacterium]
MAAGSTVHVETRAGVARITLNRPERKNAFTDAMWHDFLAALGGVLADPGARVVVLTGADSNFTAGADMALIEGKGEGDSSGPHPFSGVMDHLTTTFDKPMIAAVDGVAIGFGLTILLHCDFVYVSSRARLRAPFVKLGVVPEAASSFLFQEILGVRNTAELLYATDFIDGPRAVALGLANACVEPDALMATAQATADRIAGDPPGAVRATKRLLLEARRDQVLAAVERENAAFALRMGTPENVEALTAFWEKRPPDFSKLPEE